MESLPKVSMLLITYNQEHYVLDALKGALSQDYANLEIVVSDDCSSDSTFDIVSAYCDNYQGPHKLILNCNISNVGIGANLNVAVSHASGELFVVTAGDDISLPQRVSSLVACWLAHGRKPDLLASYLQDLDSAGNVHGVIKVDDLANYNSVDAWLQGHPVLIGAAQAWTRRLYDEFSGIPRGVVAEDMVMAFRAFGAGGAVTIPEPLVLYRRGGTTYKKRHLTVEAVVSAFVKKLDNTKIELLHMIEVAGNKHATPALLTYLVNLYQKECLIEFMLRKQAGWMGRFKYLVDAPGVALSFKIRMFFYSLAPWALRPFFLLKRAVR